ncbi:PHA/PHB synthase family protein [Quatrionicoccus australiensis]|uniref:PHA/PHB synthase family protein n=1 Tax=Quatrionicoccus australiensis TaxID=138118 RepID=UPI001CF8D4ED|nr:alpha/beta fold hydrolase [Quatrionicoccus australiensis]UCV14312.1 alpha/beta fold hydrolase [Quatrionicoccus australiensis]
MSGNSSSCHNSVDISSLSPLESVGKAVSNAFDPYGVTTSLLNAQMAWMMHPQELTRAVNALSGDLFALQAHVTRRAMGQSSTDVVTPHGDDARFANPLWTESASWDIIKEWYLAFTHRLQDMYFETPGMSDKERRRAAFWLREWLNMVAPTNFFWLNPVAMQRCVETNGESLKLGWENFQRDAKAKNIQMVEPDAFTVGKDLATTPGKVVFRNRLVELIHYAPTTDKVRAMPIVITTPWINKFYILDLNPKKSLVKYLTDQGFSVFITSWKNPGPELADVRLDDYLLEGVNEAVRVACEFCKVPQVHLVGYCIGGTLVSTYMAWANKRFGADKVPVAHWTLFTTLTDFSHPGDIDVFIDEACIGALEESMAKKGYLDGNEMATSFRLLRSNSLIWSYWVNSYLLGEKLPPFDVLFWNVDSTRMPQAMHSYYLHEMYLENNLIKRDKLTIAGESIDLDRIVQPLYAVTAEDDHIAPWKQCYRIRKYVNVKAPVRFVLSTSGHILGIVNPPANPPKRAYWIAEPERNEHWEHWQERAEKRPGTWWEDWTQWLGERTGNLVDAYPVVNRKFPALADAPGTYVLEK